jgi:hypothetical protein
MNHSNDDWRRRINAKSEVVFACLKNLLGKSGAIFSHCKSSKIAPLRRTKNFIPKGAEFPNLHC